MSGSLTPMEKVLERKHLSCRGEGGRRGGGRGKGRRVEWVGARAEGRGGAAEGRVRTKREIASDHLRQTYKFKRNICGHRALFHDKKDVHATRASFP